MNACKEKCGDKKVVGDEECDGTPGCGDNCKCGGDYQFDSIKKKCVMIDKTYRKIYLIVGICCGAVVAVMIIVVVLSL